MESDFFYTKLKSSFVINTGETDISVVSKQLELEPDRHYNYGDTFISEITGEEFSTHYGLWVLTKSELTEDPNLIEHVTYFYELLYGKKADLLSLKEENDFEFVFQIHVVTEDAGYGFDLSSKELRFLSEIVDRFTCFFNVVEELVDKKSGLS